MHHLQTVTFLHIFIILMHQKANIYVYIFLNLIHYHCKTPQVNGDAFSLSLLLFRFFFNRALPYKLKIRPDHNKEIYWRPWNY